MLNVNEFKSKISERGGLLDTSKFKIRLPQVPGMTIGERDLNLFSLVDVDISAAHTKNIISQDPTVIRPPAYIDDNPLFTCLPNFSAFRCSFVSLFNIPSVPISGSNMVF